MHMNTYVQLVKRTYSRSGAAWRRACQRAQDRGPAVIDSSGVWNAGNDADTGMELAKEYFETAGTPLGDWATTQGHTIAFVRGIYKCTCELYLSVIRCGVTCLCAAL
jgi:hypothetical protein